MQHSGIVFGLVAWPKKWLNAIQHVVRRRGPDSSITPLHSIRLRILPMFRGSP